MVSPFWAAAWSGDCSAPERSTFVGARAGLEVGDSAVADLRADAAEFWCGLSVVSSSIGIVVVNRLFSGESVKDCYNEDADAYGKKAQ